MTWNQPFRFFIACGALALALALAGCQGKKPATPPASGAEASAADAQAGFDGAEPDIKADTYVAAGWLAESRGQAAQAVQQYRQAVKLDPRHEGALYRLGVVLTKMRSFPDAIQTWKRYLEVTGHTAGAYSNLGFCYELAEMKAEAEQAYQAGLKKDPQHRACRVNYGLLLARQGRVSEASQQMSKVLTPAQVHYNLGSVFEQQGQHNRARVEYEVALRLDPQFQPAKQRLDRLPQAAAPAPPSRTTAVEGEKLGN